MYLLCFLRLQMPRLLYLAVPHIETSLYIPVFIRQMNRLAWPHRRRGLASDGVRYAGAQSSVGRRFRSATKLRLEWYGGVFLLLQQRSKHPREMVITPKASTSLFVPLTLGASLTQPVGSIYVYHLCMSFFFSYSRCFGWSYICISFMYVLCLLRLQMPHLLYLAVPHIDTRLFISLYLFMVSFLLC